MSGPISSVAQAPAAAQSTAPVQNAAPAKPQATPTDTVQISSAAQTAAQELVETRAQTTREASKGDQQAVRLLARENAAAQLTKK